MAPFPEEILAVDPYRQAGRDTYRPLVREALHSAAGLWHPLVREAQHQVARRGAPPVVHEAQLQAALEVFRAAVPEA